MDRYLARRIEIVRDGSRSRETVRSLFENVSGGAKGFGMRFECCGSLTRNCCQSLRSLKREVDVSPGRRHPASAGAPEFSSVGGFGVRIFFGVSGGVTR